MIVPLMRLALVGALALLCAACSGSVAVPGDTAVPAPEITTLPPATTTAPDAPATAAPTSTTVAQRTAMLRLHPTEALAATGGPAIVVAVAGTERSDGRGGQLPIWRDPQKSRSPMWTPPAVLRTSRGRSPSTPPRVPSTWCSRGGGRTKRGRGTLPLGAVERIVTKPPLRWRERRP